MSNKAGIGTLGRLIGAEKAVEALDGFSVFDADFAYLVADTFYGAIWSRPGLDLKTRIIVGISALAATGRSDELRAYMEMGIRNGLSAEEIKEIVIQISQYAGMPLCVDAVKAWQRAIAE